MTFLLTPLLKIPIVILLLSLMAISPTLVSTASTYGLIILFIDEAILLAILIYTAVKL